MGSEAFEDEGVTGASRPALGLVATADTADLIPARILRARQHGHEVIVTARDPDCEGVAYAEGLGATVVTAPDRTAGDGRTLLAAAARAAGYPGLLYHSDPADRVDFAASTEALLDAEAFAVDARTEPPVEGEPTVVVGIPAYNEASTIGAVVESARRYADAVLVVDDGSDDATAAEAEAAGATVVSHDRNRGYGAALKSLFERAEQTAADHMVIVDADGQHDINDVPRLIETQRETGASVVIGSRFGDGTATEMPLYRRFGLGVVNLLTNLSLGILAPSSRVRDTQSGFRAYDRAAIESMAGDDAIGDGMDASTDILYHAHEREYEIREIPVTIDYSVDGASSRNPLQHGITLVMNIVRTVERKRPITILGVPGLVAVVLGFGLGYWTVFNYVESGSFPFGIALGAAVFVIVGFLSAFSAIILHSLNVHRK